MKKLFACLMLLCSGVATAGPVTLPDSEQISLHSKHVGKDYRILVALPEAPPPPNGYPVVYVLDAELYFNTVVEALRIQSRRPQATGVVPALVVGIGYPEDENAIARRAVNYTPSPVAMPIPEMSAAMRTAGGGADAFIAFIDDELRPLIAAHHPVNMRRQVIFGHSLGGLFVLHALFNKPSMFSHYIAASPSWWWNEAAMTKEMVNFEALSANAAQGRALLLTVGEFEQKPSRFSDNMPGGMATLQKRRMVNNARELVMRLQGFRGLQASLLEIEGENHLSSLPQAVNRGLRFGLAP
ncbi:MAG: alpha/beta hydrolase-fold protein [Rhodocyclaceae bacterium]